MNDERAPILTLVLEKALSDSTRDIKDRLSSLDCAIQDEHRRMERKKAVAALFMGTSC
jgi:ribosomal protein S9